MSQIWVYRILTGWSEPGLEEIKKAVLFGTAFCDCK